MKTKLFIKRWLGLGLFIIGVSFLIATWLHIQVIRLSYVIQEMRQKKATLKQEVVFLEQQLSKLSSISKLDHLAKEKFGLVIPSPSQIILVQEGKG